jgi:hypothetical protein
MASAKIADAARARLWSTDPLHDRQGHLGSLRGKLAALMAGADTKLMGVTRDERKCCLWRAKIPLFLQVVRRAPQAVIDNIVSDAARAPGRGGILSPAAKSI